MPYMATVVARENYRLYEGKQIGRDAKIQRPWMAIYGLRHCLNQGVRDGILAVCYGWVGKFCLLLLFFKSKSLKTLGRQEGFKYVGCGGLSYPNPPPYHTQIHPPKNSCGLEIHPQ
jgi:hypothetical protein